MSDKRTGDGPFEPGHRRPNGANGVRPRGMNVHPVPFDEIEDPIDLVAVQADDELISALAAGMSVSSPGVGGYDADDRVAAILAAWKADVDAEPIPELVDLDTAVSTVVAARPPSRRARHLAPFAAAAAFIVLAIGGLSVGSYSAQPDDVLWPISRVLYQQRAASVEAAERAEDHIDAAKRALLAGEPVVAARELAQAEADLANVRPEEGHAELAETQDFLVAKAAETPQGQPTDPGAPLATQPNRGVPPGAATRPSETGTGPTDGTQTSGTPRPGYPPESGSVGRPTSAYNPRFAPPPSESASSSASSTADPSRGGEGGSDPTAPTASPTTTATSEGRAEQPTTSPQPTTTSPAPGTASGSPDTSSGSSGATASGSEPEPTTN